jgi:amidohydrolase
LAASAIDKKTAAELDRQIEKFRSAMVRVRHFIHMNPQLAYHETDAAKTISSNLATLGFEVQTGIAKTGVVGLLRGAQPGATVAIRAEMDAVPIQELADVPFKSLNPGFMHATGHDIHTAIVLGTAFVLNEFKDRLKGNVKFIFQPAGEGPPEGEESGAALMIKEGVLENPRVGAIFGFHIWSEALGQVSAIPGQMLANADSFDVTIKGRSAHGSQPQDGLDAIALAAQVVTALQTLIARSLDPADPAVLTIGRLEGGTKADLIADRAHFEGIVRSLSDANRKKIARLMDGVIKGVVHGFGAEYTFSFNEDIPSVSNHPELFDLMTPSLNEALGDRKISPMKPQMMADDFSLYGQKIPALYFFLGSRNPRLPAAALYSPMFNPDERTIGIGMKILCHLLLDCLEQQSRLEKSGI